jgi:hypothetical protein
MARGPVYDNAVRLLAAADLAAICAWLGIEADAEFVSASEALPAVTHYADLITRVGPGRLAHVEFVRRPTADLPYRMLEYRARIMRREPGVSVSQYVVLLGEGSTDERMVDDHGMALDFTVVRLRDHDPAAFLTSASLAPLAVLARPGPASTRTAAFRTALSLIAAVPEPGRRHDLLETAAVLAAIHLDAVTIEQITEEVRMPFALEGTVAGNQIAARAEARGEARGQASVLAALLRRRFGADPRLDDVADDVAARLARLPHDQALDAVLTATDLADLL